MKPFRWLILLFVPNICWAESNVDIVQTVEVAAPIEKVFAAFASNQGVQTFFAPASNIDFRVGGAYEILFFPDRPSGQKGAEEIQILALEPGKRLSITWNAPPKWPEIRAQRTVVTFNFEVTSEQATRVTLTHSLWGDGQDWAEVREYFNKAWPVILSRLQDRFDHGPRQW